MKKSSFVEGAFIATICIIISKILGLVYVIPFYSIIGDQGGALYGYAYNIYNLFLIISTAGIPFAISKLTSEYHTLNQTAEKMYMYKAAKRIITIFSVCSFLICFIFAPNIAKIIIGDVTGGNTYDDIAFVIRCVSFALLIVPFLSVKRGYLQGHKYISVSSFSQVIEQLVRIAVIIFGSFFALKIFNLSLTTAVGVAVFGATISAISAYFYLVFKSNKNKELQIINNDNSVNKKAIVKKIIIYTIPFIIANITNHIYNTVDMVLVIKSLSMIGYNATDIETISATLTTWGHKLNSIVTAIATGLSVSLMPSLVSAYVKKDIDNVNKHFNTTIKIILFIILPLSLFISIFAKEVWTIFYGASYYGPIIFRYSIIVATLDSAHIILCNTLQSLNKYKLIYTSVISGLVVNALLDVPLVLLFNKIGIYPYYGAITATVIGYILTISIALISLKKNDSIKFMNIKENIFKLIKILLLVTVYSLLFKLITSYITSRIILLIALAIIGIIFVLIYYFTNKDVFNEILGERFFKKLRRKQKDF